MRATNSPVFTLKTFTASRGFVRHVQMLPVHDDAAHGVAWPAVLVKHHREAEVGRHILWRVVAVCGKASMAGRNKRAGEEFSFGIVLAQVRGHRCRLAGCRYERQHSVGILGGDVDATIISQVHIEGVHHRREMPGLGERLLESKGIAVPVVARYVAVFAPRIRDVEVVAHQREAARDVQRMRGRRWIEDQRMLLARRTIILEDANVVDAMPRFTSIANPPHGAVLPETIAASLNSARDAYLAPQGGSQLF